MAECIYTAPGSSLIGLTAATTGHPAVASGFRLRFPGRGMPGGASDYSRGDATSAPETTNSARLCDLPTVGAELSKTVQHPLLQRGLLRHIPKGARSGAGHLLTKITEAILKEPHNVEAWRCLLAFGAGSLEVTPTGRRRRSLTF